MLNDEIRLNELHTLEHRHDSRDNRHFPYEDKIMKISSPSYLWKNKNMNGFLSRVEKIMSFWVQKVDLARNFLNFTVDKYYNDYWG